jgi:hypothetical protein
MSEPYLDYDQPIPPVPPEQIPLVMVICPGCGQTVYEQDCIISRGDAGVPQCLCLDCHQKQPAKQRKARKAAKSADRFRQVIQAIGQSSAPTISDLCLALTEEFGGISGFAKFYYKQLCQAVVDTAGSTRVLNACAAVSKIIAASTVYQATLPDVGRLSDQELCDEWERGMKEVVRRIPHRELLELVEEAQSGKGSKTRHG